MKNKIEIVLLSLFALGVCVVALSASAPANAFVVDEPLQPLFTPREAEKREQPLADRLIRQYEAEQAEIARIAAEEEAARLAAEQAALEAAEYSEQLTPYQLQVYIQQYGCTPEQRRGIESGGNYGTNTGNGYLGAYQFSAQYNAGRWEACFGTPYPGHDAFLADSAAQDQLADWYADTRYGGWQNVPSTGGW